MISHTEKNAIEKHSDRISAEYRTDAFKIRGGFVMKLTNLKLQGPSLARDPSKALGLA